MQPSCNWACIHFSPVQSISFTFANFHPFLFISTGSQWRLGKRHPGLQLIFSPLLPSSIQLINFCQLSASGGWRNNILAYKLSSSLIVVPPSRIKMSAGWGFFFSTSLMDALLWTHSMQAGILLPLPGWAGYRPELVAHRLLPLLSCQVKLAQRSEWSHQYIYCFTLWQCNGR